MTERYEVPIASMRLDKNNPRLSDLDLRTEPDTQRALARALGSKLIELAADITDHGLDPSTLITLLKPAGSRGRFVVLEGNRRVLALKALETPAIVSGELSSSDQRRLEALSARYIDDGPIESVLCVVYDVPSAADHWLQLRHTGANKGAGLVEWGSLEQERFMARHGLTDGPNPAAQILDLLDAVDGKPLDARPIITTLTRLISTPEARDALGIDLTEGNVRFQYPDQDVLKVLRHVVGEMRAGDLKVGDLYTAKQRRAYAATIAAALPFTAKRKLAKTAPLPDPSKVAKSPRSTKTRVPTKPPRKNLIPANCPSAPKQPRCNAIYFELRKLDLDDYVNSASVMLRVLLELSIDDYRARHQLDAKDQQNSWPPLKGRILDVAKHARAAGAIDEKLFKAISGLANDKRLVNAGVATLQQYVHNPNWHPTGGDLRQTWDTLEPFLVAVWA